MEVTFSPYTLTVDGAFDRNLFPGFWSHLSGRRSESQMASVLFNSGVAGNADEAVLMAHHLDWATFVIPAKPGNGRDYMYSFRDSGKRSFSGEILYSIVFPPTDGVCLIF